MQLALAISASNTEFTGDLDGDQIRAAKLLSLGRDRIDQDREEGTAESLSRRYWVSSCLLILILDLGSNLSLLSRIRVDFCGSSTKDFS